MTVEQNIFHELAKLAKRRGISIQEFIRVVILPEWLKEKGDKLEDAFKS